MGCSLLDWKFVREEEIIGQQNIQVGIRKRLNERLHFYT